MKCALVIPSWVPRTSFLRKRQRSQINYWQPLGTLYVAAVLQKAGHEVKFINGAFLTHEELLREIKEYSPRLHRDLLNDLWLEKGQKDGSGSESHVSETGHLSAQEALIRSPCRNAAWKMPVIASTP